MRMITASLLLAALPVPVARARLTHAAYYAPGVMGHVARVTGQPRVNCMVASPYYRIGTWLGVSSRVTRHVLHCRVTDQPRPRDRARILARDIGIEFDYPSARRMCRLGEPPRTCVVAIWRE